MLLYFIMLSILHQITSPELKVSSTILHYGIITICVFVYCITYSKDDKVKIHYTVWLQGSNLCSSNIAGHNT